MKPKTISLVLRILGLIALLLGVGNIVEEGKAMIYDINGIIIGVGFLLLSFFYSEKKK